MRTLLSLLVILAWTANANAADVTSYNQVKELLGLEKTGDQSRTFFGVVNVDAANPNGGKRFTCMALKFIADDENKRVDYMYKGWNTQQDGPCEFYNPQPVAFTSQHILCMNKNYETKKDRHIVIEDVADAHGGNLNLRALDLSGLENGKLGAGQSRCNFSNPMPAGADPVSVAPMKAISVTNEIVNGSEAKGPQRLLKIRLDLSNVNPGRPEFENVDYLIMLDKHAADVKLALANSRFEGTFNVDYVQPGPQGFDYANSADNDLLVTQPSSNEPGNPNKTLADDFEGDMAINFAQIIDQQTQKKDIAYTFERKNLPDSETDDKSCNDGSTTPRKLYLAEEIREDLAGIERLLKVALLSPEQLKAMQAKKEQLETLNAKLEGMQAAVKLKQKPVGYIMGKKCLFGQYDEKPLIVPLMQFDVSDDKNSVSMGAFLGQFNGQPILGFSHYELKRVEKQNEE